MARRAADPAQFALFDRSEVDPKLGRAAAARLAAEAEKAERVKVLAEWQAQFERVEMDAPWTDAGVVLGWKCPDQECGKVEPNTFLLRNNHGWDPERPGWYSRAPGWEGRCTGVHLRHNHAIYDARRAMIRHLCAEGLDDEQIAARIDFWSVSTIAGYRKDDTKAARRAAKAAKGEVVKVGHGSECPCAYCEGPCSCPSCEAFRGNPPSCFLCGATGGLLTLGEPPDRQAVCAGGCRPAVDPLQGILPV